MDINKVAFGDYSLPSKRESFEPKKDEDTTLKSSNAKEAKNVDANTMLDAMNLAGIQNKFNISQVERKQVNPLDYLSEDRISDIEAMMGKFEDGVGAVASAIENEFPGVFAEDSKNALAAKIFAQE